MSHTMHEFILAAGDPLHPKGLPEGVVVKIEASHEEWTWEDLGDCQGEIEHFSGHQGLPEDSERWGEDLSRHFEVGTCTCDFDAAYSDSDPVNDGHDEDCLHDFSGDPKGWRRLPAQSQGDSRETWWRPNEAVEAEAVEIVWEYVKSVWTGDAPCVGLNVTVEVEGQEIGRDHLGMCFLKPWNVEDSDHEAEIRSIVEDYDMVDDALRDVDAQTLRTQSATRQSFRLWLDAHNRPDADEPHVVRIDGQDEDTPMHMQVWPFARTDSSGEQRVCVRIFCHPEDADETHSGGRQIELDAAGVEALIAALSR